MWRQSLTTETRGQSPLSQRSVEAVSYYRDKRGGSLLLQRQDSSQSLSTVDKRTVPWLQTQEYRRQSPLSRRQESGDRSQEIGVRRQEPGDRSQETGVRSPFLHLST